MNERNNFYSKLKLPQIFYKVDHPLYNSINPENSLCLEPYKLYEAIVIIKWPDLDKFNVSAMGVRFPDEYSIFLNPYDNTDTNEILEYYSKSGEKVVFTVNFIDDPIIFAKAALFGENSGPNISELDNEELYLYESVNANPIFAVLREANGVIIVESMGKFDALEFNWLEEMELEYNKKSNLGNKKGGEMGRKKEKEKAIGEVGGVRYKSQAFISELRRNRSIGKNFKSKYDIRIKQCWRSKKIFQPTNRGYNLAIEAIVLASKLPYYINLNKSEEIGNKKKGYTEDELIELKKGINNKKEQREVLKNINKNKPKSKNNKIENKILEIIERIRFYESEIRRFSADLRALTACKIIDDFLYDLL
ncbi:MAG: DUF447 domain-containing protein [Promethearchaeota archaeon]